MQSRVELESYVKRTHENLLQHPMPLGNPKGQVISIGDLHANTMKLIHFLCLHGVLCFSDRLDYNTLLSIYEKKTGDLTIHDLTVFTHIIEHAHIQKPGLLIFIGDELADRGKNDYFTLIVFKKLYDSHVPYRIMLLNHGYIALTYFLTDRVPERLELIPEQIASYLGLRALFDKFPSYKEYVGSWLDEVYIERLALIGYSHSTDNQLILYTHTPTSVKTITGLRALFDADVEQTLEGAIDRINENFIQDLKRSHVSRFELDFLTSFSKQRANSNYMNECDNALFHLLWNRERTPFPAEFLSQFKLCANIHGHTGPALDVIDVSHDGAFHSINLDGTYFGKPDEIVDGYFIPADNQGELILFSHPLNGLDLRSTFYQSSLTPSDILPQLTDEISSQSGLKRKHSIEHSAEGQSDDEIDKDEMPSLKK